MNPFLHNIRTYALRFRWELVAWALLTTTASILALSTAPIGVLAAAARIETIFAVSLLIRICLADEAFGTLAGKQTRPLLSRPTALARPVLLALAFVPALVFRCVAWNRWATPDRPELAHWSLNHFALTLSGFALLAISLQLLAWFVREEGFFRKLAIGALSFVSISTLVSLAPEPSWLANAYSHAIGRDYYGGGHGGVSYRFFQALPESAVVIGHAESEWLRSPEPLPSIEVHKRILINDERPARSSDDIEWRISEIEQQGTTLKLKLHLRGLPENIDALGKTAKQPILFLRYSNGFFSVHRDVRGERKSSPFLLSPLDEITYLAKFESPLALNWNLQDWESLMKDAELWVMAETDDLITPPEDQPVRWNRKKVTQEELQSRSPMALGSRLTTQAGSFIITPVIPSEEEADLAVRVDACMSLFRGWGENNELGQKYRALLESGGRQVVPHLLRWPVWSEGQWHVCVKPFLMQHARLEDRPILLDRLADDPRLIEVFIAKGWKGEALPVLRARARERKSLPLSAIELLAAEPDPVSANDLAAIVSRLDSGADKVAEKLRRRPGFDWDAFVRQGWKTRKYGLQSGDTWHYALWAAELGDPSALRRLAEEAAAGRDWQRAQLTKLIPSAPIDLIPFLRENLTKLSHDPETETWQLN